MADDTTEAEWHANRAIVWQQSLSLALSHVDSKASPEGEGVKGNQGYCLLQERQKKNYYTRKKFHRTRNQMRFLERKIKYSDAA